MNTQVGKTFGLALLVAVGILAVMFALGTFSAQKTSAESTGNTVTTDPVAPGAGAPVQITVKITNDTTALNAFATIAIEFPSFGVPSSISTEDIYIDAGTESGDVDGNPARVTVSDNVVTLRLNNTADGGASIAASGSADIIFWTEAGITAPTTAGNYRLKVDGTAVPEDQAVTISASLTADPGSGGSGTEITVSGKAFSNGTGELYKADVTATITAGPDGTLGNDDDVTTYAYARGDLITSVLVEDGTFSTTVVADDFDPGDNGFEFEDAKGTKVNARFSLTGTVTVSPTEVNKGDIVTIELTDWTGNDPTEIRIGSQALEITKVTDSDGEVIEEANPDFVDAATTPNEPEMIPALPTNLKDADPPEATISVRVHKDVNPGTKTIVVVDSADATLGSDTLEIATLDLIVNPSIAVPGQEITITGNGFSDEKAVETVKVGGVLRLIDTNDKVVTETLATSSGRIVISIVVPLGVGNGDLTVQVTDANGRVGEGSLTVPKPTITLDPASSRRSTTVIITGTGFPSGGGIDVTYDESQVRGAGATANDRGSWTSSLRIPSGADIDTDSEVVATSEDEGPTAHPKTYSAKATHSVPAEDLVFSSEEVQSGDTITIDGVGFPAYAPVLVTFGGLSETNTGASTDGSGDFTTSVLVPALDPGTHLVRVEVNEHPSTKVLTILGTDAPPKTTDTAVLFADATSLVRVWKYDNATQGWEFYDPDPALASAVDYMNAASGDIVWISVTEQETFQGSMLYPGWNTHVIQ